MNSSTLPPGGPLLLAPVVAHRGASGDAPENTLGAIRLAADQGARCIEIDVSISRDDVPFVHHDATLERCTNGAGRLCDHDAAELDRLQADKGHSDWQGESLPRLSAVVELCRQLNLGLNLEIKPAAGLEQRTARAICTQLSATWPEELPFVFSSFSTAALDTARECWSDAARALLVGRVPADWKERLSRHACRNLHCAGGQLTAEDAGEIVAASVGLYCYTVNDPVRARELLACGVHGVFTDHPGRLLAALPA